MPITIIWGERDQLIPLSSIAPLREAQASAEVITLPNAGHVPQGDAPREVVAILRAHLARC